MFCSWASFPVSTTYSIISAVAGVGVAIAGADRVQWGWNDGKGLGAIFAGLGMAPAIAAGFGAILFTIVRLSVLVRKNPARWAIFTGPFFFFLAAAVSTMSIIYKGAPTLNLSAKSPTTTALAIVLTALVIAVLAYLFWVPYVYCKVIKKDYTLRWYHVSTFRKFRLDFLLMLILAASSSSWDLSCGSDLPLLMPWSEMRPSQITASSRVKTVK